MPLFYFDIREGNTFVDDEEGLELPNIEEAEQEAIKACVSIGKERLPRSDTREVIVEVHDEERKRILTVGVKLTIDRVYS